MKANNDSLFDVANTTPLSLMTSKQTIRITGSLRFNDILSVICLFHL